MGFELVESGEKKEKRKGKGGSGKVLNLGRPDVETESWLERVVKKSGKKL